MERGKRTNLTRVCLPAVCQLHDFVKIFLMFLFLQWHIEFLIYDVYISIEFCFSFPLILELICVNNLPNYVLSGEEIK
jgi:hypothetical protein